MSKKPVFNMNECINCGICVQACPLSCLSLLLEGKQGKYRNVFPELISDKCIGCGLCATNCPMDVIEMQELKIEQMENDADHKGEE